MYTPQAGDSPWVAGLKRVGSALGWNDPNAVMGVGVPMGAPTSLAGEATAAAVPSMETVAATELPQATPSSDAVEGLVNGMKARLNQIPSSTKGYVMPTSATPSPIGNSTFDIFNPATQAKIEEMYQAANPAFKEQVKAGVFGPQAGRTNWIPY